VSERVIAHVDMDAFYASVEIRDDPALAGRPVVVGGSSDGRGVVSAASYEARRYGIHSAMPMARAERLCPELVRVRPNFVKYHEVSGQIMEVMRSYAPAVEPLSLDEAFLDLTGTAAAAGSWRDLGVRIKQSIRERTRLTASVGFAPVKFVAKIASDLEKPDGLVVVGPGKVEEFLRPLPISRLWGVGPRTREILETFGIRTIGDLAAMDPQRLAGRLGQHAVDLIRLARGEDSRDVVPDWDAKSYSHEETFARDVEQADRLEAVLLDQAIRVARRLRHDGVAGRVVQLKLRDAGFHTITRRTTLPTPTDDADEICRAVRALFARSWNRKPVRLIGTGVSAIGPVEARPLDLFEPVDEDERRRRLADTLDALEDRYGKRGVTRARLVRGAKPERADGQPGSGRPRPR